MENWRDIDFETALGMLHEWTGRNVVVRLGLTGGPAFLAGFSGVLRAASTAPADGVAAFEVGDSRNWFGVARSPGFEGASYCSERQTLVLESAGGSGEPTGAVLVDVQATG